jgi:hypothetical protein
MRKNRIELIDVPSYLVKILAIAAVILTISEFTKEPGKEIICEGNIFRAGYDLIINAHTYNNELNAREELMQTSVVENKKYVEVPALTKVPQTIYFIDISSKANNWVNISTAKYFGLDSIKLAMPTTDTVK